MRWNNLLLNEGDRVDVAGEDPPATDIGVVEDDVGVPVTDGMLLPRAGDGCDDNDGTAATVHSSS